MTGDPAADWLPSISRRAGVEEVMVANILEQHGVHPATPLGGAHHLIVRRVTFSGEKAVEGKKTPFSLDYRSGPGLWCIASHDNSVGKSSLLGTIISGLRGDVTKIRGDVRNWMKKLRVEFEIDGDRFSLTADITKQQLLGTLSAISESGGEGEIFSFSRSDEAAARMNDFMLERLELKPIASSQRYAGSEDSQTVKHEWPSYLSGLVIDSSVPREILLGTTYWANLPGRLLSMFAGLPWASTTFATQAALKQASQQNSNAQRRVSEDKKARGEALAPLVEQIRQKTQERDKLAAEQGNVAKELDRLTADHGRLSLEVTKLKDDASAATEARKTTQKAAYSAQRKVHAIEEAIAAHHVFYGLNPDHCPRCRHEIDAERLQRERESQTCSVCNEHLPEGDPEAFAAALAEAQAAASGAKEATGEANTVESEAIDALKAAEAKINAARDQLQVAEKKAQTGQATRLREVELELAALQARRETLQEIADSAPTDVVNPAEERVLRAALEEAKERSAEAEAAMFNFLRSEILALGRRFGVAALERVEIDRKAALRVWKGGDVEMSFAEVSDGERLRLRLAAMIAIIRYGINSGFGRHPGIILADSIGGEEAKKDDVAEFVKELIALTEELPSLQLILASARPETLVGIVPEARLKLMLAGEKLF